MVSPVVAMRQGVQDAEKLGQVMNGAADIQITMRNGLKVWTIATLNTKINLVQVRADQIIRDLNVLSANKENQINSVAKTATDQINSTKDQANSTISRVLRDVIDAANQVQHRGDQAIDDLNDAINIAAAAGAGANGWTDKLVAMTNGGTLDVFAKAANSRSVSISQFGNITDALDFIEENNAYLYLNADQTYTLTKTNQFLSRLVCQNGYANVVIPNNVKLTTNGQDLIFKNINLLCLGKRLGLNDASTSASFVYDFNMPAINHIEIDSLKVYGLLDQNDLNSFEDDLNKTRIAGFANIKVNKSSVIKNVEHFGFSKFINMESIDSKATHIESNVIGYNCETNIYLRPTVWESGNTDNVGIKNTVANKRYWLGQDNNIGTNGKDSLMCAAEHETPYIINNVWAINAIEKSLYNQCQNTRVSNIYDDGCLQIGQTKHSNADKQGDAHFVGLVGKNPTNLTGLIDVNGYKNYTLQNIGVRKDLKDKARVFIIRNLGNCIIDGFYIENSGCIVTGNGNKPIDKITFKNGELFDCFNSDTPLMFCRFEPSASNTFLINEMVFSSIVSRYSEDVEQSSLSPRVFDLDNILKFKVENSNFRCRDYPFKAFDENANIEVLNTEFEIFSVNNCFNAMNRLRLAENNFKASYFDFKIKLNPTDALVKQVDLSLIKKTDGIDFCYNYIQQADFLLDVTSVTSVNVLPIQSGRSFKIVASCESSKIELIVDSVTKQSTQIYNVGSLFNSVKADNKICISLDSSSRVNIDVGNATSYTHGNKKILLSIVF